MKLVQVNVTCGSGSTGKICISVSRLLTEEGIENYILYSGAKSDYPLGIKYQENKYTKTQALASRIRGNYGFNSSASTKKLIAELERIKPDIIHLHNLHGHNCNVEMLFNYLKKTNVKLYWTFHDCWTFTGYCPYFDIVECDKWQEGCESCPQRKTFSWFFDKSSKLYQKKKELFSGLDLTIVTPSEWLADLVKKSFFKDYPVRVINNGIDISVFKPTYGNFAERYNIAEGKHILLGVAFDWGARKGLDVFCELAGRLDPEKYQIVLVGTNDAIDQTLPKNIISIHRTQNQAELAEIYTAADLFVNPTREENYPTVNMESIACGTPVLTFDTGGSAEMLNSSCGCIVKRNDIDAMEREIIRICKDMPYTAKDCVNRAKAFDANEKFKEYVKLYKEKV